MTDKQKNQPILSDDKQSANFCMSQGRFYCPILSAINLAIELGSNFAEKMGDKTTTSAQIHTVPRWSARVLTRRRISTFVSMVSTISAVIYVQNIDIFNRWMHNCSNATSAMYTDMFTYRMASNVMLCRNIFLFHVLFNNCFTLELFSLMTATTY